MVFSHLAVVHKVSKAGLVNLFEFHLANMAKATYENARKLCSGVFSSLVYMFTNTTLNRLGCRMLILGTAIFR